MTGNPATIVADFYHALATGDTDAIGAAAHAHFAEDASIEWPPSLPHGGRVQGARKLRAIFSASANPEAPAGAKNLELIRVIGTGDDVVAWIKFDWQQPGATVGVPNQALELWRFTDGKVTAIQAFYWDSDAVKSGVPA